MIRRSLDIFLIALMVLNTVVIPAVYFGTRPRVVPWLNIALFVIALLAYLRPSLRRTR